MSAGCPCRSGVGAELPVCNLEGGSAKERGCLSIIEVVSIGTIIRETCGCKSDRYHQNGKMARHQQVNRFDKMDNNNDKNKAKMSYYDDNKNKNNKNMALS